MFAIRSEEKEPALETESWPSLNVTMKGKQIAADHMK